MLEFKDLRYFVTVYEEGSFTRAAEKLITVQSAVSDRIQRLERDVGALLFVRQHRAISPTAKGQLLYEHAKRVLAQIGELEGAVRDPGERRVA